MPGEEPTPDGGTMAVSDQAFRSLVRGVEGTALVGLGPGGHVRTWNPGAETLTGWTREEARGMHVSELYPDSHGFESAQQPLDVARQEGRFEEEGWCVTKTGSAFWASMTLTPLRDAAGDLEGFGMVLRDLSERKRAEAERRLLANVGRRVASAETFTDGVETALAAVCGHTEWACGEAWVPADDGTHLEFVAGHAEDASLEPFLAASRPVTFPVGEGLPGRVYESASPEWMPDASAASDEVFHRSDLAREMGVRAALGVPIQMDDRVVAVLTFFLRDHREFDDDLAEVVTGVAGDLGELFERKRTEDASGREHPSFERVFAESPVGLLVVAADGEVLRANAEARRVLGDREPLTGRQFDEAAGDLRTVDGEPIPDGESAVAQALDTGDPGPDIEFALDRDDGETAFVSVSAAPIGGPDGDPDRVAVAIEDITRQTERERALRRQRDALDRIRRIVESHRPINRDLGRVNTREEIDRLVCEGLASSEMYQFAWFGDYNQATGEITPREWAGVDEEFVRGLDPVSSDGGASPFAHAVHRQEVRTRRDILADPPSEAIRERAAEYGFESLAAVPVMYGETVLGVVGVYSSRSAAFGRYERGLLGELGERVGHAINAAENRQLLHTDAVVELEFESNGGESALSAVAAHLDCRLSLNNVAPTAGTELLCHVEVEGAEPGAVVEAFESRSDVAHARVVRARGSTGIVEVAVEAGPITTLFEHGATLRSLEATGEEATLVGETAPQSDVKALITDMEASHDGVVFVAKRTRDVETPTLTMTKRAVEDVLTDRQQEVLTLAYHAGYFESPRHSTGDELASALGIASPTFYQHVRKGIRKVMALLVEGDQLQDSRSTE